MAAKPDFNIITPDRVEDYKPSTGLLKVVLRVIIPVLAVYLVSRVISNLQNLSSTDILLFAIEVVLVASYFLLSKGRAMLASILTISAAFLGMTIIALLDQGVRDMSVVTYSLIIIFTTLLSGKRVSFLIAGLSIVSIWLMVFLESEGIFIPEPDTITGVGRDMTVIVVLTTGLAFFYDKVIRRYIQELSESHQKLQNSNTDLLNRNIEIKKMNEELRKAKDKAEESDRLKSAFLSNMSHEIRTPMNAIIGFSELSNSEDISNEIRQEYNKIIADSCRQLLGVVNDIVDISKIESGIIDITNEPLNLNELMAEMYNLNLHIASGKGLEISYSPGLEDDKAIIMGDRVKLSQVLGNLISNAIKFSDSGAVRFGYEVKDQIIEFMVSDTGKGISDDQIDKIFDRFSQEDNNINRIYGGTGLGLSIARAYIEKMGGSISVKSEIDKGSQFRFDIPYKPKHKEISKSAKDLNKQLRKKGRILIVEDIEVNERLLLEYLKAYKVECFTSQTGKEALEIVEKEAKFDMIFMDIKLPDIDGYEVTRIIRKTDKDTAIIAQTAYGFAQDREMAIKAGCNDVITKPLNRESVHSMVQKYLM